MKSISFVEGLGITFIFALVSAPLAFFLGWVFPYFGTRATIVALSVLYIEYMLSKRRNRAGSFILGLFAAAAGLGIFLTAQSLAMTILGCTALIWLMRSLVRYRSIATIGIDGCVSLVACFFGFWSFVAVGFTPMAVWSFFLVQATTAWIPAKFGMPYSRVTEGGDPFHRASEAADAALTTLIRRSNSF